MKALLTGPRAGEATESGQMTRWHLEYGLSGVFVFLAVLTAVVPDWIEVVFGVEPDAGSGALEWAIVGMFGVLAAIAAAFGRRDYKAAHRLS
jgi:hypothetical protein